MAQEVTLGGDRLGSGNKQKVPMHNYGMNSFNLEQDWKSSMAPGILYPFMKLIGTNHGTFDIDLGTMVRTLPTKGPLFGSFKLQVDLFSVPLRLYQGILHNNPIELGLNMGQVYLPKVRLTCGDGTDKKMVAGSTEDDWQVNTSSLLKYCGISGWGRKEQQTVSGYAIRKIQCVPMLAYYDIFKCYYSNKQEENAYVITPEDYPKMEVAQVGYISMQGWDADNLAASTYDNWTPYWSDISDFTPDDAYIQESRDFLATGAIYSKNGKLDYINIVDGANSDTIIGTIQELIDQGHIEIYQEGTVDLAEGNELAYCNGYKYYLYRIKNTITNLFSVEGEEGEEYIQIKFKPAVNKYYTSDIVLRPFKLKNIDDMRNKILGCATLGTEMVIRADYSDDSTHWGYDSGSDDTGMPYLALSKMTPEGISWNAFQDNGLVVKTYQSDLFNNWLDNDYITGVNGISAITAVDTSAGSFTMDALNLAEKVYELLNRIVVGGGTYQDWQDACYGEGAIRMCETPMYVGGYAAEVMFEEVISSAETNVGGDYQPLGSLGGRGRQVNERGGHNIHVRMEEPGYVMGIVSLTPRICYSQGNDWDMTELDTINDLHKPALDGIGFQDLIVEQFAWWNTILKSDGSRILQRNSAGKQTAWINYQTAVDKCYGDFAKTNGYAFMVLNRNYEHKPGDTSGSQVKDITTYIDPAKFNYAFAYTELAAQNFWVQIHSSVIARRKMGAQQIPNL